MSSTVKEMIPCPPIPFHGADCSKIPVGFETFTFGRYRFEFTADQALELPRYKGSVFRGGLGRALREISCSPGRNGPCASCILSKDCAYARVFETPVRPEDKGLIEGMSDAPHPMVLRPPRSSKRMFEKGEPFECEVILIGEALRFLPQVVCAFEDFGKRGVGSRKGSFKVQRVSAPVGGNWEQIYSREEPQLGPIPRVLTGADQAAPTSDGTVNLVEVCFETPLRIKSHGGITDELTFELLLKNVLRRIHILDQLHCRGEINMNHEKLVALAAHVRTVSENLWWVEWSRNSQRKNMIVQMGGLIGRMVFEGDLYEFLTYLELGKALHVGKGTAYGMGWYSLKTLG